MQDEPDVSTAWGFVLLRMLSKDYRDPEPPWPLKYFGEQGVGFIIVENRNDEWMARARALFPQANVAHAHEVIRPETADAMHAR